MSDRKTIEELKAMLEAATPLTPYVAPTDEEMTKEPIQSVTTNQQYLEANIRKLQQRADSITRRWVAPMKRLVEVSQNVLLAHDAERVLIVAVRILRERKSRSEQADND
jgi:predicted secreted protein